MNQLKTCFTISKNREYARWFNSLDKIREVSKLYPFFNLNTNDNINGRIIMQPKMRLTTRNRLKAVWMRIAAHSSLWIDPSCTASCIWAELHVEGDPAASRVERLLISSSAESTSWLNSILSLPTSDSVECFLKCEAFLISIFCKYKLRDET